MLMLRRLLASLCVNLSGDMPCLSGFHHGFAVLGKNAVIIGVPHYRMTAILLNFWIRFQTVITVSDIIGFFEKFADAVLKFTPVKVNFALFPAVFHPATVIVLESLNVSVDWDTINALANLGVLRSLPSFATHGSNAVFIIVGSDSVFVWKPSYLGSFGHCPGFVMRPFIVIIRTAVLVLKAVLIFRNIGTLVYVIRNSVAIAVRSHRSTSVW